MAKSLKEQLMEGIDTGEEASIQSQLLEGVDKESIPTRQEPLTQMERVIVQNLFDTDLKKRKQYLKQLGLELDPSDSNKYRPLGSTLPFTAEIDPGIGAFFQPGGLKELGKDISDVAFTTASNALVVPAAVGGAAFGTGLGGPVGTVIGAIFGGAAGNAAAEALKEIAGNTLLDENIPIDFKEVALESLVSGAVPELFKLGKGVTTAAIRASLDKRKQAIINAAKQAGTGLTPEILTRAAKEPDLFTEQAVKGANQRMSDTFKSIFGVGPEEVITVDSTRKLNKDSVFGKVVNPLNADADREIESLAKNPAANFKIGELLQPIDRVIFKLSQQFSRDADEVPALAYLRDKRNFLIKKAEKKLGVPDEAPKVTLFGANGRPLEAVKVPDVKLKDVEIDFKDARKFLKDIQNDAFNREVPGSRFLKQAIGGDPKAIRMLTDAKAAAAGSSLPAINAKRSEILGLFNEVRPNLTPSRLTSAFMGGENIQKLATQQTLEKMDAILGTDLSRTVQDGTFQSIIENAFKAPVTRGSQSTIQAGLSGAVSGGLKGAGAGVGTALLTGLPVGPSAAIGGVGGAIRGAQTSAALTSPANTIRAISDLSNRSQALSQVPLRAPLSTPATQAVTGLGRELIPPFISPADEEDLRRRMLLEGVE